MCDVSKLHLGKKCCTPEDPHAIIIQDGKKKLELCMKCWDKVAELDWEVGEGSVDLQAFFEGLNVEKGYTPTEFKYKSKVIEDKKDEEDW